VLQPRVNVGYITRYSPTASSSIGCGTRREWQRGVRCGHGSVALWARFRMGCRLH